MDIDELQYNVFYLILRNEYRKKYDFALKNCWTICVPCTDSLRNNSITKEFVDDHILKPFQNGYFTSTDEKYAHMYKIENEKIKLIDDEKESDNYEVKIISIEKGYNKEYQPYNIIILDKPIHRKYRKLAQLSQFELNRLQLNRCISNYQEALNFLEQLQNENSSYLDDIAREIAKLDIGKYEKEFCNFRKIPHNMIRKFWAETMRKQSLDLQRDARFQKLLSVSYEIFVMNHLHPNLYPILIRTFEQHDEFLKMKIDQLNHREITPIQLGVKESLISMTPVAMVELATLDSRKGPFEKLTCLKGTLDFLVAEIKATLATEKSKTDFLSDSENIQSMHALSTDDLIPLLLYVIIKCRIQRLLTDLVYVQLFTYCLSPNDELSYILVTFKAALHLLQTININDFQKKSDKENDEPTMNEFLGINEILLMLDNLESDPLILED